MIELFDYQREAVNRMKNGCILCGGVGSGKSLTAIAYYFESHGGKLNDLLYYPPAPMPDLYIITTARKRDSAEWESDLAKFGLFDYTEGRRGNWQQNKVVIDSWNNIGKYAKVKQAFFIFDEQRVSGRGAWVTTFLKICKVNEWILLSATPGDKWEDYIPVFVANGFYKNRTRFCDEHVVWAPYVTFPKILRYTNEGLLERYRNQILVKMDYRTAAKKNNYYIYCDYDKELYTAAKITRKDPFTGKPFKNVSQYCACLRYITNSHPSRARKVLEIVENYDRVIIFYNFDYELEALKSCCFGEGYEVAEWNGHTHEDIPNSKKWVYLCQYNSNAEGWNCITTNCIIFYSQSYSWRMLEQSKGRIDRLTTKYKELDYYHIRSLSQIDVAIGQSLKRKKLFNERSFVGDTTFDQIQNSRKFQGL